MRRFRHRGATWAGLVLAAAAATTAVAQTTPASMGYHGYLTRLGQPFEGYVDLDYRLYDLETGGAPLTSRHVADVHVGQGLLAAEVDFGIMYFDGTERWLEVVVDEQVLHPRQRIASAPYAMHALNAPFVVSGDHVCYTRGHVGIGTTNPVVPLHVPMGSDAGPSDGGHIVVGNVTNKNLVFDTNEIMSRNNGAPATLYINHDGGDILFGVPGQGQTFLIGGMLQLAGDLVRYDDDPLEFIVAGKRTLSLEKGYLATSPNIIGGHWENTVPADVYGATIGGGGHPDGWQTVSEHFGTIGGGSGNTAGYGATVAGGVDNTADGNYTTVGGGTLNAATGGYSTIAGGEDNGINSEGNHSAVAGGAENVIGTSHSNICGGENNIVHGLSGGQSHSNIGGGLDNTNSGFCSSILGGRDNTASGLYASVLGGAGNEASGNYSFAAGLNARAVHDYCFVWNAPGSENGLTTGAHGQFLAKSYGGFWFYTTANEEVGAWLPEGSGNWLSFSDRAGKDNLQDVDYRAILDRLSTMPVYTWNYKTQSPSIRHIGPTAQGFNGAFGFGEDEKFIGTIDADGVALAAIKGLHEIVVEQDHRIVDLEVEVGDLKSRLAQLEAIVSGFVETREGGEQ